MAIRDPAAYPWPTPLRDGVIGPNGWREELWEPRCRRGRLPVLAVGSNASPEVLRDKLSGPSTPDQDAVYLEVCAVAGLAVGHSAHLSLTGFVAAAPFRSSQTSTYSLAWLTPAQTRALDATEPNYDRRPIPADVTVAGHNAPARIEGVTLYVSHHGVLAQGGCPVALMSQRDAVTWLRERLQCLRGVTDGDAFADPGVRESVRLELAASGWVAPSGL